MTAYRALARKYRSQHFGELIGQDVLVRTLSNAIEKNRLHHAYLFTGIRGTGKTSTARILAKAINYSKGPTTGPTDDCTICQAIAADQCPDVIEIDAASNTGVDDVRQIIENARYAPMQARYKVFIIDEVHMLSKSAFNALLKTLEEPPAHVVFMLATTEIRKVPVTILSRCQRFDLRRVDVPTLNAHYKKIAAAENIAVDEEALQIIARAADGSVRDGLSLLDQAIAQGQGQTITGTHIREMLGQGDRAQIASLITAMLRGETAATLDIVQQLYHSGADPMTVLEDMMDGVHLITRFKIKEDLAHDTGLSPRLREMAQTLAPDMSLSNLARVWQMLLKAQPEIAQAGQPIQALEMALIRICFAGSLPPLEELTKRGPTENTTTPSTAPRAPSSSAPVTAPQMRVVSSNRAVRPQEEASPVPTHAVATVTSLHELIALCDKHNEPMLAADLYANVNLVRLQPGHLELHVHKGASKNLIPDLIKFLPVWTGQRWTVTVAAQGGAPSLREQERTHQNDRIAKAHADPALAAWKKHFPNLTISEITE